MFHGDHIPFTQFVLSKSMTKYQGNTAIARVSVVAAVVVVVVMILDLWRRPQRECSSRRRHRKRISKRNLGVVAPVKRASLRQLGFGPRKDFGSDLEPAQAHSGPKHFACSSLCKLLSDAARRWNVPIRVELTLVATACFYMTSLCFAML